MARRAVRFVMLVACVSTLWGAGSICAQDPGAPASQASALAWLSLIDNQSYAASWDAGASMFRSAVTQEQWQTAVQNARGRLGELKSRTLTSTKSASTLPGAPDGDYVVLQFQTSFGQKAAAVETVTTVKEADGAWRVVGYFVR